MARTDFWRRFKSLVAAADVADRLGWNERQLLESLEAQRDMATRREFMRGALGVAATLATAGAVVGVSACATSGPKTTTPPVFKPSASDPVAIIGGGLSGLTCAYRLAQAGVPSVIYEASSSRLGGRTWTLDDFSGEGRWLELGGEFIDTGHVALRSLARELGLEVDEWATPEDRKLEPTVYWFDGVARYERDLALAARELAARVRRERKAIFRGRAAEPITCYDFARFDASRLDRMSLGEWLDATDFGSAGWARKAVERCFVGECGREVGEQSALNLLTMCDGEMKNGALQLLGESDMAWRVRGGNERVATLLASNLKSQPSIFRVETGATLTEISDRGTSLRLSFDRDGGGTLAARVSRVVLALPFSCLRNVEGIGELGLDPRVDLAVRRLTYGTCSKFAFATSARTWRKGGAALRPTSGSFVHDLPSQQFWDSSRHQPGSGGVVMNYCGGKQGLMLNSSMQPGIISEFERVLPEATGTVDPNLRAMMNWSELSTSRGAFSQYGPGDYESIAGAASRPQLSGRLLFAGEHASVEFAGFMNGAVDAGERAAAVLLGQRG